MRTLLKPFCLSLLVLFAISMTGTAGASEKKINVLIVTGFDVGSHKWEESTKLIQTILEKTGRFDVSLSEDKEVFASPSLGDYNVVVLNFGFWKESDPSEKAKAGLLNYVKQGGNTVALHFACSAFQDWKEYRSLLGRVWVKETGGHGPYGPFTVKMKNTEHPITKGLKDFKTEDELYAKLSGDAEIEVLATAYSDWSGKVEPIVFVKRYGKGRVVQNVLGHGIPSKKNPSYQGLLSRCVEWAATGKVTIE
ncbi:MAG: ThuA domain-containing protein [Planctomycetes bacterium]|nr:ThuA domain-containing protein [Planctomycetota bacterium]